MTERSLFNVICKIVGLWMLIQGISSLVWAFVASRSSGQVPFDPSEGASWFSGAVYTCLGLVLTCRSSAMTRFVFRLDAPLDETASDKDDDAATDVPRT